MVIFADLAYKHLCTAFKKEKSTSPLVNTVDGDERGGDIDRTGDHGGHERSVSRETDGVEQNRSVKHNHIDPG